MKEIWKPVIPPKGFDVKYELSDNGNINNLNFKNTGKKRKVTVNKNGEYYRVPLKYGEIYTPKYLHVLIWETFVGPIPPGYDVHHIDEHTEHNYLSNLELKESKQHVREHQSVSVIQFDKQGNFIKEWTSMSEVERQIGISHSTIAACCLGKYGHKTAGGFIWKYKEKPE